MSLDTILVANRGEIACRVMRTVQGMGLRAVAVYSDADRDAPHVRLADDAAYIGPSPSAESYLRGDAVLEAARATGADAVHPGYGFLSENADFARACEEAGITFIGPPGEAIDLMGNKAAAKRRMLDAGVPCVPGYQEEDQSDEALLSAGREIGFPLMVKAAAGGGGRGMRLAESEDELASAIERARPEAESAFGSGELILEKAVVRPRHVEIQVFADGQGNTIHLGERDCSIQRRHQKVIEEAPCPVMTPELRERMGTAGVRAADAIGYRGAGTVEFLLDADGSFYFLEMNTRLQVEHPVTELITGLDLVALQIRVARGERLGLTQDDVTFTGHAMEARLYAEDPARDFMPATGTVALWHPATGPGVRVDDGVASGQAISPFYDPMIAKVIAWGESRDTARQRLAQALRDTALYGPKSNKAFLIDCLERTSFARGEATTAFIPEEMEGDIAAYEVPTAEQAALAAVVRYAADRDAAFAASLGVAPRLRNWSTGITLATRYQFRFGEEAHDLAVTPTGRDSFRVRNGGDELEIELEGIEAHRARLTLNGRRREVLWHAPGRGRLYVTVDGRDYLFVNALEARSAAEEAEASGRVTAPMHGVVQTVHVEAGQQVEKGERLAVVEAMKMQHDVVAPIAGEVSEVHAREGQQVAADALLITIAEADDGSEAS